jgi:hypothetical protein
MVDLSRNFQDIIHTLPFELRYLLKDFFQNLYKELPLGTSVVLIGSASRGELTWFRSHSRIKLIGDVEFVVFTSITRKRQIVDLVTHFIKNYNSKDWGEVDKFEIDFGVVTPISVKLLVRSIWLFECQKSGVVIFGKKDPFGKVSKVTIENIDFRSVDYLIMVRLWNVLKSLSSVDLEAIKNDEVYLRNILDGLTIYLPRLGILSCGYHNRLESMLKVGDADNFIRRNIDVFKWATIWKVDNSSYEAGHSVEEEFFHIFEYLNINRSSYGSTSLLFSIRCKVMTYYFYRRHLRRSLLMSIVSSLMRRYDEVELMLLKVLFTIHRTIIFKSDLKTYAKEIKVACDFLGISYAAFITDLESQNYFTGHTYKELSRLMEVWFYARSAKK